MSKKKPLAEERMWAILPQSGNVKTISGCDLSATRSQARRKRAHYNDKKKYRIVAVTVTVREVE